jgi:hypothetical protein
MDDFPLPFSPYIKRLWFPNSNEKYFGKALKPSISIFDIVAIGL